jgi:L-alanine-DL-glutamate epimerase-like enolase superfamily enzyme
MACERLQETRIDSSNARTFAALLFLLVAAAESAPLAGQTSVTAVELLTAFSGEPAIQYQPFFQFSEDSRIVAVEIHAVGTESTTARYSGREHAWHVVNNILRITTADGFEGISGVDTYYDAEFGDQALLELRSVAADLIALQSLDPVVVGAMLERSRPELSDEARASIDIALWDLAARRADRPLYQLLGAQRDSMEPYASLPFYDTLPEYVDAVNEYARLGYRAFKFHVWGSIEEDSPLVALIQQTFADSGYRFMIDLEGAYGIEDALRLGEEMNERLFIVLEAAIDDQLLAQYAQLRNSLGVAIHPAGYDIYSSEFIRQGIETGAWDAGRFDATTVGGISTALQLLTIANDADLTIDIQSWGHSLAQAANLHLMLANKRTRYFEAPMPKQAYEFGMKNGDLLALGRVVAPPGAGLGIEVDWEHLPTADFYRKIQIGE